VWSDGWRGAELDRMNWRETIRWKEGGAEVGDDTGGKCRVRASTSKCGCNKMSAVELG